MLTVEVLHRLEGLHPTVEGEWTFHREVFGIDAYAVRLWQGRDAPHYRRVSYEVKVSRADFLNEVKKPEKRRTAVALSHYYYLAMPAELAAACLPDVVAHIPEAGVLAVHDEPPRDGWSSRSPFVGAGPLGCVRVLRAAPIRSCRGWTAREWSNLMRRQHRPDADREALRLDAELAREHEKAARRREKLAEQARDAAHAALARLGERLVKPGQVWTGPWTRNRDKALVRAVVEDGGIQGRWAVGSVRLRLLDDAGDPVIGIHATHWMGAGEFLSHWVLEGSGEEPTVPAEWLEVADEAGKV